MLKKILLFLIVVLLGILIYFSSTSKIVKDFKAGKNINILFVLDDVDNTQTIKFAVAKYSSLNEYIKTVFIDENVTIVYRTKKARILKDMILEVEPDKRIDFIKSETETLFDNKFNIDYFVCLTKTDFKTIINSFSKQKDLENNLRLLDVSLNNETDRNTNIVAKIKVLNYLYNNFNRFTFIKLIKELYNKILI